MAIQALAAIVRAPPYVQCRACLKTSVPWFAGRDKAVYELGSRGVRVVSGRSEDTQAADSNGAGKSALVMAPGWALSGRSDARLEVCGIYSFQKYAI